MPLSRLLWVWTIATIGALAHVRGDHAPLFLTFILTAITAVTSASDGQTPPLNDEPTRIRIEDFETEPKGWRFVGGEEFPGAKGALALESSEAHGGKSSYKLEADFRGGGAYVGTWKDFEPGSLPEVEEFRVWVRTKSVGRLGVRVVDGSGQCHQKEVVVPLVKEGDWAEVVLKLSELVGGEHWDGANDGRWHGAPKGLGINIGKNSVSNDSDQQAELWIDDLSAVSIAVGTPTLRSATLASEVARPGYGTRISYVWDAKPMGSNCSVFVHFLDAHGQVIFQGDHEPTVPTARWLGRVAYGKTVNVPAEIPPGRYDVVIGLWNPKPAEQGGGRKHFCVAEGLASLPDDACRIGALEISAEAPIPKLPAPSLNLDGFALTFDESFDGPLSVSAWGPGTRWIAHTPYGGDFGDAGFADPEPGFPFTTKNGMLRIEAKETADKWRSGLLCSVDPNGAGFSQKYGYFEMRAKLPKGLGTWPAFWLMGVPQLVQPKDKKTIAQIEIDVVEQYGVGPNALHTTLHTWGPGDLHWADGDTSIVSGMTDDFHTYGVLVDEDFITFYFDGAELRKDKTPEDAKVPLYLMVDLALGGGWPIDKTPNPSHLLVDHIRVYARK